MHDVDYSETTRKLPENYSHSLRYNCRKTRHRAGGDRRTNSLLDICRNDTIFLQEHDTLTSFEVFSCENSMLDIYRDDTIFLRSCDTISLRHLEDNVSNRHIAFSLIIAPDKRRSRRPVGGVKASSRPGLDQKREAVMGFEPRELCGVGGVGYGE